MVREADGSGCEAGAAASVSTGVRSTPAPTTSPSVNVVTRQNEIVSEVRSAIEPMAAGAIRPEVYVIVATPAMAWLGAGPLRPAAAKASGTATAMPSPMRPNPTMARAAPGR